MCACQLCTCASREVLRKSARVAYCTLFSVALLCSWLLRDFAQPLLKKLPCESCLMATRTILPQPLLRAASNVFGMNTDLALPMRSIILFPRDLARLGIRAKRQMVWPAGCFQAFNGQLGKSGKLYMLCLSIHRCVVAMAIYKP